MANIIISPSKYVQGKNEMAQLGSYVKDYGKKSLILISESGIKRFMAVIEKTLLDQDITPIFETFKGESSKNEINRLQELFDKNNCDNVIGVGGGKILDTAKAVAYYKKCPIIILPTVASTDAPCSALTVIYSDQGVFEEYLFLPQNPNLVLVDTQVITDAPARLLISGMGDALATYFEARACKISGATSCAGGESTLAAQGIGKLCYETLINYGYKAKIAIEQKICTKAVENIIEANTLLSGIGFESGGLAAAHAIHNGFTVMEECHNMYHGEKVAFGTIVQLVLEDAPELSDVINFCKSVGLPTTLKQLGIKKINPNKIKQVAQAATASTETIHNLPFKVTADDVYGAILITDALGQ
ncbi:glycerol dehydrogenase [Candidatus Epulonipiscium viviparus]|uniref:glycerol dehydrogenase n=1 Tax=Candidatus Epulonipiscium viviparus TaxID=420336 RepID=UPI00273806FC|nr:glycerol dehydrogenase [Candidatus Epulopiscium viviparus]